jgi:RNA recognition motif-containing protein
MLISVDNLPRTITEKELAQLFRPFGYVDRLTLLRDRDTGRSQGRALIEMRDEAEAHTAIAALHGVVMKWTRPYADRLC